VCYITLLTAPLAGLLAVLAPSTISKSTPSFINWWGGRKEGAAEMAKNLSENLAIR